VQFKRAMTARPLLRLAAALVLAAAVTSASAQDASRGRGPRTEHSDAAQSENRAPAAGGILRLLPADSVTEHSVNLGHGKLAYTATAGTLPFFDQSGEKSAALFYTAYVAKDAGANRPLTFVFNGGPGASSAYLHLGVAGPRILDLGPGGRDAAHAELRDNPDTWLAFTDLVFIDPIGTGWSRTVKADDAKHFFGVNSDAEAMAKAITLYVDHNNRAASPKYLFGESYGGFRAAKVARALPREQGLSVAGIVMLSPLLEGWLTFGDDSSALRSALQLPSLAAAELERRNAFSPEALAAAEKFALTDYLTTLAGAPPQGDAGKAFYERVAKTTGMPLDAVTRTRGFITDDYVKSLRGTDGKIVSRYDATFAVDDPFPELRSARGNDPILDGVSRAYGGGMADYARNELGFKTEMTYILLAPDVSRQWDWQGSRTQVGVESDLRQLLAFDSSFHVLIAHGRSDMVTPYGMARYVVDHLPVIGAADRVQLKLYRGGHMIYLDPQSRKAFAADAAAFYRAGDKVTR
jgi:carboxypeptidase C (cathepsin A)